MKTKSSSSPTPLSRKRKNYFCRDEWKLEYVNSNIYIRNMLIVDNFICASVDISSNSTMLLHLYVCVNGFYTSLTIILTIRDFCLRRYFHLLHTLLKKKRKFSSSIKLLRRDRVQIQMWITASSYMTKYLRIFSSMTLHLIPPEFPYV